MIRDLLHHVKPIRGVSPVSGNAGTSAEVSQIIDMQGYSGCLWVILLGAIADADATFAVLLEEGADSGLSDAAAVADADMITQTAGTAPEAAASFQYDSDNGVRYLDYIGSKRYIRLTVTPTANTGAWLWGAGAIKYGARHAPAGVTQVP